jgi:superfamily I DNA/RNA helicase
MKDSGIDVGYASTIHGVKGEEFESVLVVMDKLRGEKIIKNWGIGEITESERVIYVATTRAKKLLCVAVPTEFSDAMKEIVENNGVNYEIIH